MGPPGGQFDSNAGNYMCEFEIRVHLRLLNFQTEKAEDVARFRLMSGRDCIEFTHPLNLFSTAMHYHRGDNNCSRVETMLGSCPECDADIQVAEEIENGARLRCPVCRAYLIVVGTGPVELDWVYIEDQLKLGDEEFEQ